MCLSFFLLLTVAGIDTPARAQSGTGGFFERTFKDDSGEHKYVVFVPANYRSDKPTPAILFLHGAGERGKDNRLQMTAGLAPFIQPRLKTFPFIVVLPQCASTEARILEAWQEGSADSNRAMLALEDTIKHYNIDQKRIVLTGWSMGGYGTWSLAMAHPTKWSGVVPLAGGGDISKVAALKDVPVWAFHGALDKLVHPEEDRKMVDALNAAGGKATYTELPQTGHYLCEEVYGNESVIQWMLDPQKTPAVLGKGPLVKSVDPIKVPFVPAVEIPEAVAIRLGNDALSALSFAIPDAVPADMLSGRLNDMFDSTVAQGRSFGIRFSGLSYRGRLERVLARGTGKDRIAVQLGARDITLTIGGTSISGERHSAQAGPINIVIGNRYPVWLNVELEPTIKDRQIKLKLIKAGFQIPDDNWYVSAPAGVSTQGFGMTESAVVEGLTSGLYGAKGRIENEVLSVVPGMLAEVEKMLVLPDTGSPVSTSSSSISRLWPLPIYPPRMRIWPQQISTDEKGISLVVGITAASMDPYGPAKPLKVVESAGAKLDRLPRDSALHAMVAPQILTPLTEMAVEADQLKLDLLDIPDPLFTRMADRATLQEIIPDLKQYGDDLKVRSSLRIIRPLEAGDPSKPVADSDNKPFEFRVHGIQIAISIKTDAKPMWQPCAVFELDVTEQVKANLSAPVHDLRIVSLDWQQETGVAAKARFADGYTPRDSTLNTDQYVDLFKQAWKTFSKGTTAAKMEVPDLAIGRSRLRLDGLRWNSPLVEVTYHLARIKITNLSPEPFTYETKAPTSPWGQPLTLKPGDSHEFEIPYPLTYRRKTARGDYEVYTLTVGSHSEYRVPLAGGAPRLFEARKPPVEH
jgi:predicted esterase